MSEPPELPPRQSIPMASLAYMTPEFLEKNPCALWSLVLSILSFVLLGPLGSLPAVILGHIGLKKTNQPAKRFAGRGLAIAGLIIGYFNIAACIAAVPVLISGYHRAQFARKQVQCLSNLRAIGMGCIMYMNANKGYGPTAADDVAAMMRTIGPGPASSLPVFHCPFDQGSGVSYDFALSGGKWTKLGSAATTVIAYDKTAHPNGSRCVLFLDGHCELLTAASFKALNLTPASNPTTSVGQ